MVSILLYRNVSLMAVKKPKGQNTTFSTREARAYYSTLWIRSEEHYMREVTCVLWFKLLVYCGCKLLVYCGCNMNMYTISLVYNYCFSSLYATNYTANKVLG